ncbi:MAG: hypothetical protein AAB899_02690 [Patescibacteria group bacterium]
MQKGNDMDALDKLVRKLKDRDKLLLLEMMQELKNPESRKMLDIKKLSGRKFYRVRKGIFRIIFHFDAERIAIDAVRMRNEKTYRGF